MKIVGITAEQATRIANNLGIRALGPGHYNDTPIETNTRKGPAVQMVLRPAWKSDTYRRTGYVWNPGQKPRRINAVCFHGHRDFMRGVYRINPNAVIRTGMLSYQNSEDFERNYWAAGERNIGSEYRPMYHENACLCGNEDGLEDFKVERPQWGAHVP